MARILIADDDPQAREVMGRICQFQGHETLEVNDAAHALREIDGFRPDVVITDLAMPMGGGQFLVRELRASSTSAGIPVVVVTGYGNILGEAERAALEPCIVLPKPLELHALLEALDSAVGRSSQRL